MQKLQGSVTMKGDPVKLTGSEVNVGEEALNFVAVANDMSQVQLSSFRGKVVLIASVPSLDTPVCDVETRRFNTEVGKFGNEVVALTISMDLPFAQKRWCAAAGVHNLQVLSDHRAASFGKAYGVLIEDLRLLARAVFVVDRQGNVRYKQLVREITSEPDYQEALTALKQIVGG